eukprot:6204839-Pleurochrysis_carterae.AAC.1
MMDMPYQPRSSLDLSSQTLPHVRLPRSILRSCDLEPHIVIEVTSLDHAAFYIVRLRRTSVNAQCFSFTGTGASGTATGLGRYALAIDKDRLSLRPSPNSQGLPGKSN